ncbi:cilia- and flagella-associated protein 74-like isoform X1 [Pecten maximus]|uniref:cilia- and flagella-associated protein 74-like isoform X1 n=1 Tax=Pecten maximus TaxID=6579 RepID=UPI001458364E|nr:cilia- and flagella-associated protein 74-like isoform X1 [Pecten maximus]XP_033763579.1 cilia- and flagella-associated protein 74-like isoform X1 [Pecten maximus]
MMEDQNYGQMYGGEEYMGVMAGDDFDDNGIIDCDDGDDDDGMLDLGSEEEESVIEEPTVSAPEVETISKQEQLRMIHLRSHLNQLTETVKHHRYLTEKTREEQKQCRNKIETLESERDQVFTEIQGAESDDNTSALYRLRTQHERICTEIENEQKLETLISERLEKEEYELAKVDVERGKFLLQEDELIKREQQLAKEKTDMALNRLQKEEMKARKGEEILRKREKNYVEAIQAQHKQQQMCLENAQKSHEKHSKYLKETVAKHKVRQEEENIRYKENMQKKMDMLLKLKGDITANRENLKALHARDKAMEKEEKQKEELERRRILSEGGNPDEVMLIRKRIQDVERAKTDFHLDQKSKQAAIMDKILLEEDRMRKRKKQLPNLWVDPQKEKTKIVGPMKKKPLRVFKEMDGTSLFDETEAGGVRFDMAEIEKMAEDAADREVDALTKDSEVEKPTPLPDSSDSSDAESDEELKLDLAEPEFEGLWDQHKPYKVPKDSESTLKLPGATKMDREIMTKVLDKHRSGIILKQVAAGREFQGCPFYSKPDVIHFKDFVVGHTYKKRVTLTNVSYTVNYCRYINITERLKDFIEIVFDPPGQMSAGLTCEMLVTFKPMINEDLVGEVNFLSQTGPFSIPLHCSTKKCDLSVDTSVIEFGTTVIGETLKRTFTLTNKGALGTKFEFFKVTGSKQRSESAAETSLGRLTTADTTQANSPDSASVMVKKDAKEQPPAKKALDELDKASQDVGGGSEEGHQAEGLSAVEGEQPAEGEENVMAESPELAVSDHEDYGALDGMKVGAMAAGELEPFSSVKLEIIWQPTIPGKVDTEFLISFSDPLSESISVQALANAIDVPVWVERQTIDLRICMYDRLYQDTVIVNNRATTALRLKFEVCKELRNHLELLPKTGYIQAQSQFSAQLKFLPRQSLFEEAGKYFDKETGVLEAPMTIRVADQTAPVPFTVQAVVTTSDMEFDTTSIDFGCCTIYESVKTTIKLANKSILPQEYGFVGLPDYLEVQPDDGFGTLLPLETIDLEVIFSPKKARDYKFELNCKSLINREFKIQCKGVGVHPPLELSHQVVHFAATALYDVSTASLHVVNSHTSTNEFTHPVPRIGKGDIAPVGPTSFEFVVPEGAPLTISPSVGTIEPGKKTRIQIRFTPSLPENSIKKEAVRMGTKMLELKAERDYQEQLRKEKEEQEQAQASSKNAKPGAKDKGGAKGAAKGKSSPVAPNLTVAGPRPITPPTLESITRSTPSYTAAQGSLLRQFRGSFRSYTIPCYVASGECSNPGELPYSIHNTLYLEVHCPIVKPTLVVISDNGNTCLDFGEVSLGQNITKTITIQNISNKHVELRSSIPDTSGPFLMLNALRLLPPEGTHTLLMSFTPTAGRVFQEVFKIYTGISVLHVTLAGKGVNPVVDLSMPMENGVFNMGAVLVSEYVEKTFKMQNSSSLSIDYCMKLESLSLLRHTKGQELPEFVKRDKKAKSQVGTQNNSGQNVFDLVPSEGTIPPGGTTEVTVTFAPDHPSDYYSDGIKIELFGKEESHSFKIVGMAKPRIMFVHSGDSRFPNVESLADVPSEGTEEEEGRQGMEPVMLTLESIAKENEYVPASRDLHIGCVRTMAVSQKKEGRKDARGSKNGEFQFDNVQPIIAKGFGIEPQKGMVEAGVLKPVTFTWTPPVGHDPNQIVDGTVTLTLKGDVTEQLKVMLRAMVVSE